MHLEDGRHLIGAQRYDSLLKVNFATSVNWIHVFHTFCHNIGKPKVMVLIFRFTGAWGGYAGEMEIDASG